MMRLREGGRQLKVILADSAVWLLQTVLGPVAAQGFIVLPERA